MQDLTPSHGVVETPAAAEFVGADFGQSTMKSKRRLLTTGLGAAAIWYLSERVWGRYLSQ